MIVSFDDRKLQKVCENEAKMRRQWGQLRAKRMATRLHQLQAVEVVTDLLPLPGNWHELSGDRFGTYSADLDQPYRIIVRPSDPVPMLDDGGIDWGKVAEVTVVEIVDYH